MRPWLGYRPDVHSSKPRGVLLDWRTAWPPLLWAVAAGIASGAMMPLEPVLLEEGLIVHFAQRMAHGEHLYRDLVFFSGPLPFELLSLLFRVFGEETVVARSAMVVLNASAAAAAFGLARGTRIGPLAHVAALPFVVAPVLLFPLASIYFYSGIALALSVLAAFAACRGLESRSWAVLAGVLAALVAVTKQSVGIVLAPGLVLAVAIHARPAIRWARTLDVVAGGLAVTLATLGLYGVRGDLNALWNAMVVMPLSLGTDFGSRYPDLWPIGVFPADLSFAFYMPHIAILVPNDLGAKLVVLTQALYALPFAALLTLGLRRLLTGPLPAATWIGTVVLLAALAQLFPRSDWGHLVFVLPPALFVLTTAVGFSGGNRGDDRKHASQKASALFAAFLIAGVMLGTGRVALALHRASEPSNLGPRVPQRPISDSYRGPDLGRAIDYLRTHSEPGEPIFVARAEPLLYLATGTRNPTPYGGIIPGLGEEQEEIIIEALADVRYVAMSERDSRELFFYREELPAVQRHLERHFRVAEPFLEERSWMIVLERGEDRGATVVDLFEGAARAEPWVRRLDDSELPPGQSAPKLETRLNRRPLGVIVGPKGGGLDFEVEVPSDGVFQASLGLRELASESDRFAQPRHTRFEVWVDDGSGKGFELIGSRRPRLNEREGRHWTPFEVDLSAFAGETVRLRLAIIPRYPLRRPAVAWWGSPRLISRPEAAAEPTPAYAPAMNRSSTSGKPASQPQAEALDRGKGRR